MRSSSSRVSVVVIAFALIAACTADVPEEQGRQRQVATPAEQDDPDEVAPKGACAHDLPADARAVYTRGFVKRSARKRVMPTYPEEATRQGVEGEVLVEVVVDGDGVVVGACAVDGPPQLREAAKRAGEQWEFEAHELRPADPEAVPPVYRTGFIHFRFRINQEPKAVEAEDDREAK